MTIEESHRPTGNHQAAGGPEKVALQRQINLIMRGLLRTPLVSRGIGRKLMTIYVVGRKSGRRYPVPVAYTRHDGKLLVGTSSTWSRNLRTGDQVEIRLHGKRCRADVEVLTRQVDVVELYTAIVRGNRNFAKFNKIAIDAAGEPDSDDLNQAWAAGARAIRLTVVR